MNLRIASTSLFLRVSGFLRRLGFWTLPLFVLSATWDRAEEYTLTSPDGNLRVLLKDGDGIRYTLQIGGSVVLTESRLGLRFQDGTTWGPKTHFVGRVTSAADTTWDNPFGKDRLVRDHYNELSLSTSTSGSPLDPTLIVRAYNDGLAFRYRMPAKGQLTIIAADLSTYHFAGDYPCWAGTPSNCAESTYSQTTVDHLPAGKNVAPVLVQTPSAYVALCEADLRKWAGSFFSGGGTGADLNSVQVVLEDRLDHRGCVVAEPGALSPWHVIMAGETMSDLFESELINNLATPSRLQDITWIKPGITAWDPWWPGVEVPGAPAHGDTVRMHSDKAYIDLASEMGWQYQLIDGGWYHGHDVTLPGRSVDIPGLVRYARARGVRELLWMNSKDVRTTGIARSLDNAARWGVAGLKIDFINSCSQESVTWCEKVLEEAAARHLLVDFHGMYVPTGLARTWPNFITQEGVRGNEYNQFSSPQTAERTLNLALTRDLLGPMDFTPGAFLNVTLATFAHRSPTVVPGTRARQLALSVIYFSPLLCLCDSPQTYRGQPGLEFFRGLPTVWDETRLLEGDPGKAFVVARRSGENWYVAAINQDVPSRLTIPTSFLGKGNWMVHAFADGAEAAVQPTQIDESKKPLSSDALSIHLAPDGGYVATLTPAP